MAYMLANRVVIDRLGNGFSETSHSTSWSLLTQPGSQTMRNSTRARRQAAVLQCL